MRRLLVICILVLAVGCSKGPPDFIKQNNQAPHHKAKSIQPVANSKPLPGMSKNLNQLSLSVEPATATKNTTLHVKGSGFPMKDAQLEWLLNGVPTATPRVDYFDSAQLDVTKGDTVQAKATVDGKEVLSNVVTIADAKPEITNINLVVPDTFEAKSKLSVDVSTKDDDGDPVTLEYKWEKNGVPAGNGPSIDLALQRGDQFSITVTPYDGEEYGQPSSFTRAVGNFPPKVAQQYAFNYENGVYTYQVKAEDPDGDPLTYVLKSGPKGMTINSTTGLVTWAAPPDFKGKAPFVVAVQDGHGGETQMQMSLISEAQQPPAPAAQ